MAKPLYAILLDGGYLTKRLYVKLKRHATAADIWDECQRLMGLSQVLDYELLRIYYYDAFPSSQRVMLPISKTPLDLAATPRYRQSQSLFDQLVLMPHFALRMGEVVLSPAEWRIKSRVQKSLIAAPRALTDQDFDLDLAQKGVDMRVGMDMARLALRELVRAVIVVTGDTDFVPAFKFVRREGVKVILERLGQNGSRELRHHADIVL
ncbi:MAG: NYN domain-containing protein [Alphaproteobacteria bacterium]|nr:NYN domain-containing protein [Alphaproteobacteria bacterium]